MAAMDQSLAEQRLSGVVESMERDMRRYAGKARQSRSSLRKTWFRMARQAATATLFTVIGANMMSEQPAAQASVSNQNEAIVQPSIPTGSSPLEKTVAGTMLAIGLAFGAAAGRTSLKARYCAARARQDSDQLTRINESLTQYRSRLETIRADVVSDLIPRL